MNDNKLVKTMNILIYILIALFLIYGFYIFARGILTVLNIINLEGLKTPYNLILGSFLITISILYIINKLTKKAGND